MNVATERSERTWKSVGSAVSQLRVHPTMGLNLFASSVAKSLAAATALWLDGSLETPAVSMTDLTGKGDHVHLELQVKRKAQESDIVTNARVRLRRYFCSGPRLSERQPVRPVQLRGRT